MLNNLIYIDVLKNINFFVLPLVFAIAWLAAWYFIVHKKDSILALEKTKLLWCAFGATVLAMPLFYYEAKNDVIEQLVNCHQNKYIDDYICPSDKSIAAQYTKLTGEDISTTYPDEGIF